MGYWGTEILSNDISSDVYDCYFELYDKGEKPATIAEILIKENKDLEEDNDIDCGDYNNFWFSLALALWETNSLDIKTLDIVKKIIDSERDIECWADLGASEEDIQDRKIVLEDYLKKLSSQNLNPTERKKATKTEPIFEKGECLIFKLPNNNYGGALVLEADNDSNEGWNLIATTKINMVTKPTIQDFHKAGVLVINYDNSENKPKIEWYNPSKFHEYSDYFQKIGKLKVERKFSLKDNTISNSFSKCWDGIINQVVIQLDYENNNKASKPLLLSKLISKRKWWQFF